MTEILWHGRGGQGALTAVFDGVAVAHIEEAIRQNMPAKLHDKNIAAVKSAACALRKEAGL